ncbi:MAG: MBL fold metallo-hydrolase [Chlamydiae bacterium]|nr:MBL fold metallo-hydrolase [Chlamydiota bacterium]
MKGFCPLASGSKGNSIYIGTETTKLLVDAGLSAKSIIARLNQIGVDIKDIDAILVTHEHIDHIRGLFVLCSKWNIPIFANSDTAKAILSQAQVPLKFKIFSTGETFEYGDIEIHPFSVQHDAADPVAFTFSFNGIKIGVCADLGFASTLVENQLRNCDYLYIEANHQPEMVHASARPMVYKQRVLSRQGHLSNEACAKLVQSILHKNLKYIFLAHLSSECNAPDLAISILKKMLDTSGASTDVSVAYQDQVSHAVLF